MFAWDDNRVLRIRMLREERKNLRQKQLERNAARAEQQDQWENNVTGKKRPNASKPDAKRAKTTDAKDNGGKKGGKHEGKDAKDDKVAGSAKRGAAAADTAAKSEDGSSRKRPSGAERRRANKEKIRALKEARKAGKATTDGNPNSTAALPAKRKPQENGAKRSAQNMPAKSRAPASTPAPKPAEQPREQPAKKPKTSKPNAQESRRSRKHNAEVSVLERGGVTKKKRSFVNSSIFSGATRAGV